MKRFEVFAVADMNVDLLVEGNARPVFDQTEKIVDRFNVTVGGSANIFACQFAKLGGAVGLLGTLGLDPFGDLLERELSEAGVDLSHVRRDPAAGTGVSVCLIEQDDRAILTWPGTIHAVRSDDLRPELTQVARHWHIASFFLLRRLLPVWPSWLRRLKAAGVTVSLDTNWAPEGDWSNAQALFPLIDVFLPNAAEAMAITGEADPEAAGRALARQIPLVVVKCGESGAVAFQEGKEVVRCKPPPDLHLSVVDTVGAGDSFDAGFLRAWLMGKALPDAVQLGNRCGAHSLRAAGGVASQLREAVA